MGKSTKNQRTLPVNDLIIKALIYVIKGYQFTLSPDHGPLRFIFVRGVCCYSPSCSQYMIEALEVYGWRGFFMGVKRVGRCHPFAQGGYDPVDRKTV